MGVSKLKNLIIAALALVNVFFLAIILWNGVDARVERQRALDALVTVVHSAGIRFSAECIELADPLPVISTSRNVGMEEAIVTSVLGKTDVSTDASDNAYTYSGTYGTAEFNRVGEFRFALHENVYTHSGSPSTVVRSLASAMDVEMAIMETTENGGDSTVRALCTVDGIHVYSAEILFTFSGDSLVQISGRLVFPVKSEPSAKSDGISSVSTALLSFTRAVTNGELECTEITSVSPGYIVRVNAFGEGELIPVWRVETDAGSYHVSDVNGEIDVA